ncbi:MAG: hypothetical protein ACOCY8_01070 [Spirochaetota bacterium]
MARKKTESDEKKTGTTKRSGTSTSSRSKKSSAAKKGSGSAAAERAPVTSDRRSKIISEIVSIAEGLEDDGLDLLLEQAKTVEYKGKIEKFNRRLNVAAREAIEARRAAGRPNFRVAVERTEDDFFIIQMDDVRVFFNRGEMRELTRLSHKAKGERAGARSLFRWFERERSDLLADAGINSAQSPYLTELHKIIVSTYKVKE